MEISLMVSQLRNEAKLIEDELAEKDRKLNALQLAAGALELEIRQAEKKRDAILEAMNRLKGVCPEPVPVGGVHAVCKKPSEPKVHDTTPKKIGKFDAKGVKIGEFRSINQAAHTLGWTTTATKKYLASADREKQIRLRGYYLEFIPA